MLILIFLYLFVIIANVVCVLRHRKSNIIICLSSFSALLLMAENSYNPDFYNYSSWYVQRWYPPSLEKGYVFLADFFQSIGFSFNLFRWICFICCFLLIGYVVYKTTANCHVVILLYFAYQIFFDYVQIRSFMVVSLLTLAIYLFSHKQYLFTAILILFSISIHRIMIIYIFLLIGDLICKKYKRFAPASVAVIVVFCFIIFLNGNNIPFFELVRNLSFIDNEKYMKYFTTRTQFGFILPMSLQFANIILSSITIKTIRKNKSMFSEQNVNFCESVHFLVAASSIALPLVMINEEFIRISRNCNILIYIMIAIALEGLYKNGCSTLFITEKITCKENFYYLIVIFNILLWNVLYTPNSIVQDIFRYNYLID